MAYAERKEGCDECTMRIEDKYIIIEIEETFKLDLEQALYFHYVLGQAIRELEVNVES